MDDIKSILENLGYKLQDDGARYWRALPIYRQSGNPTSLRISKKNGGYVDFSENDSGPFYKLVQLSLNLAKPKDAKKWLDDKKFSISPIDKKAPKIVMAESWEPKVLDRLLKEHSYWNKRGIKDEIISCFQGGVAMEGRMADRYVFPIFNDQEKIVGFAGRDLTNKKKAKWKLVGEKINWLFPLHLNREIIKEKQEVILVESIGDVLKLYQSGFDNCLCLFGTYLSDKIISTLVGLQLKKIYISVNNDSDANDNVGNKRACDIYERLIKFFDKEKVQIKLPLKNDFGDMTEEEILKWKNLINLAVVGTQQFHNYERLCEVLEPYKQETGMVVSGAAVGTDTLGARWAKENNIPLVEFLPDWNKYGKAAGPIRNEYIIGNANKVVAVWSPDCRGTKNDIDIAERTNKPIEIVPYNS